MTITLPTPNKNLEVFNGAYIYEFFHIVIHIEHFFSSER